MPYTTKQEAVLKDAPTPITYADAGALADEFGKSRGSVISKVLSMELAYECKPKTPKRPKGLTKAELVTLIADALDTSADALSGLDKATAGALMTLALATAADLEQVA